MSGIAVRLPVAYNGNDGFALLKNFRQVAKQNFKMLVLTIPGERVMEPSYGVGITRYLFESFTTQIYADIDTRIREQVAAYMPFISIREVSFDSSSPDTNTLGVAIRYSIPRIGATDLLQFTI